MKKLVVIAFVLVLISNIAIGTALAHDDEETAGRTTWEGLQNKTLVCKDLKEDDFEALGEYFMGTMMGNAHEAMNTMMTQMMGDKGEVEMHIVMGKRLSGCDPEAAFSQAIVGAMPMMGMSGGGGMMGFNRPWTMSGYGAGWSGWLLTVFVWAFAIIGLVAVIRLISGRSGTKKLEVVD